MNTATVSLETEYIEQVKQGDERAARELYQLHARPLYNTLLRLVVEQDEAQDLLQETFITAFRKIGSYRQEAPFGAWIRRIAVNTGLDYLRRRKLYFETVGEEFNEPLPEVETAEPAYTVEQVHAGIKKLPPGGRAVLTLFLLEGYSHREIAQELNITVSTSKTQYRRARLLLQEMIKQQAYE